MDSTLLTSFLKASKVKRWLSNPDSPAIVQEIKKLYDGIYSPSSSNDVAESEIATEEIEIEQKYIPWLQIPQELRSLLPANSRIRLHARFKQNNVFFARSQTHSGNSQIYFYPAGDRKSAPVAASIEYIFTENASPKAPSLGIRRLLPVDNTVEDPFALYPQWPAKLYQSHLATSLEIIQPDWIYGHYARWDYTPEEAVVLLLNRVRSPFIL